MAASSDENQGAITGINVTPLVDVMMVLLIIFMATAPLLERRALHVSIPKSSRTEKVATETTRVELGPRGETYLDGRRLARAEVVRELTARVLHEPALHVAVAADKALPYGDVIGFLDDVRGAGVRRVGLEVQRK